MSTFLIVLIAIVVVGAAFYFQYQAHKKKVAEFQAYAKQKGWQYTESDEGLVDRFQGPPFGEGHSKDANHVLRGTHRGREILAFEYIYKETHGTGKDRRTETYRHTVVSLSTPAPRPTLELSREGLGRKLLGFVGIRDLQLESEEFNKTFHIRAQDDKFAYDILHPRMMEWMLNDQRALSTPFRFERRDLYTWSKEKISLPRVEADLNYLCDILDQVPTFVWT